MLGGKTDRVGSGAPGRRTYLETLKRLQPLLALGLMIPGLALMSDEFLTVDNTLNVLRRICVNLCLPIGMTVIILSGGIDLSVGSVLACSGAVAAGLLKNGVSVPGTDLFIMVTAPFNGLAIIRFRLPPFVATLGRRETDTTSYFIPDAEETCSHPGSQQRSTGGVSRACFHFCSARSASS